MKMSKYYTPEIEEFHHGFEYEVWENSAYTPKKWKSKIFEFRDKENIYYDSSNTIAMWENRGDEIRVKYLDQEDIESLGWTYTGKAVGIWFNKKGFFDTPGGRHRLTEYKLVFFPDNNELHIEGFFGNMSEGMLFEGIIKNKSALKKLLKQLNIE